MSKTFYTTQRSQPWLQYPTKWQVLTLPLTIRIHLGGVCFSQISWNKKSLLGCRERSHLTSLYKFVIFSILCQINAQNAQRSFQNITTDHNKTPPRLIAPMASLLRPSCMVGIVMAQLSPWAEICTEIRLKNYIDMWSSCCFAGRVLQEQLAVVADEAQVPWRAL